MKQHSERLSTVSERIAKELSKEGLTLGELIDELHKKGHMFLCLVFAAPFLLPIPLPGLSTVFGAVILLAGIQVMLGFDPWLPKKWRHHAVPATVAEKTFGALASLLRRVEFVFKPRLQLLAVHKTALRWNGFVLALLAALLALPMPPGFNMPPALAIIVLSMGVLEEDGVAVLFSWFLSLINIALFGAFFVLGYEGLKKIFEAI